MGKTFAASDDKGVMGHHAQQHGGTRSPLRSAGAPRPRYAKKVREPMRRNFKAEQELWLTVRSLAWQSENIKKRIADSYEYHLSYVSPEDMPTPELKTKLGKVHKRLKTKKGKIVSVTEAIYPWPLKSCCAIIREICDIYDELIHFEWHLHPEENQHEPLAEISRL